MNNRSYNSQCGFSASHHSHFFFFIVTLFAIVPAFAQTPLPNAHAHNDYEHARPLLDALDHGFCSVEADIYLVDGALLVAHDRKDVKPERMLQSLYLDPLRERVKTNNGRVYPNGIGRLSMVLSGKAISRVRGVVRVLTMGAFSF